VGEIRIVTSDMPRTRWAAPAALAFVLLTLAALVIVPVLVQRRVDALRDETENAEPARTLVSLLQFSLVREMASLTDFLLSGGREYAATYAAARADERELLDALAPLSARLGPAVVDRFAAVRTLAERWHTRVADEEIMRRRGDGATLTEIQRERELFEEVLRNARSLDSAIVVAAMDGRARIRSVERTGLRLTAALGVLALLAAGTVAALGGRLRRFAAESERRRREAEVALAETARATEARARLLRGITHDVKNPLGAAKGYAELLAMGIKAPILPEQAPLVEGVRRSVDGALAIIDDLLDVARADSGGLTVTRVPAELTSVVRAVVEDSTPAARNIGHTLEFSADAPVLVHTDPARVRQILENLISNAIKYTPAPGRITVRAELVDDDGVPRDGAWAAVRVSDTGPGIPVGMREAVFDEFTRLDGGAGVKGHGLGLAIARRIARLLAGDLRVANDSGPGATFVLWLPYRRDERPS
jgi:signal transduction histidine kinase